MIESLSSVTIVNVEKIPLSFCYSGGIALNLNFIECPLSCNICPWEANLSRKSAEILNARPLSIIEVINKYSPDIVMFHGGEPYTVKGAIQLLKEVHNSYNGFIGVKVNILHAINSMAHLKEFLPYINLLLVEFVDTNFCEISQQSADDINSFLHSILSVHKYVEVVAITTSKSCSESLTNAIGKLIDLFRVSLVPLNWIFMESISSNLKLNTLDKFRKLGVIAQAPLENSAEVASTFCKLCKNPIIVRQGGQLIKLSIDRNGICRYCGYRYENFKYAKRIVKNPIEIQVL